MNRKNLILAAALALFLVAGLGFAQYDRDMVVGVMRSSGALLGELNKALGEGDFFAAAEAFMSIAQNFKSLETITPKKGRKADWDAVHGDLINAAFRGIGACGSEDRKAAESAAAEISGLIKKGHGMFR